MAFPRIKDKYTLQPMFNMGFLMRTVGSDVKLPAKVIIIYANRLEERFAREFGLEHMKDLETSIEDYNTLSIYRSTLHPQMLVVRLAIGAPLTAMICEDMIRLGVKEIIIIGEAGGIKQDLVPGTLVLCTKSMRDTGTSEHYLKAGRYANADKDLTSRMWKAMKKSKIGALKGPTWSIDAPYTESRAEVERYSKMGILTVEMECAGLFAVAAKRAVKASAVFVVSDTLRLDSGWSGFDRSESYSKGFEKLPQIARIFAGV